MRDGRRPRVYFAAGEPISGRPVLHRDVMAMLDDLGYEVSFSADNARRLDTLVAEGLPAAAAREVAFSETLEDVAGSDLLIFLLDGPPSAASCVEAGIAYGRGIRCIGLMTASGADGGVMIEGILGYSIARDLDELRAMLANQRVLIDLRDPDSLTIDLTSLERSYVAVSGPLGVGKSTLIELLAESGSWTVLREPVMDNPYLSDVYANLPDYAFRNQAFYLGQRARLHNKARRATGPLLQERCLSEDGEVFTPALRDHGAYDDNDLATLTTLYHSLAEDIPRPDLLLYLTAPFEVTLERIRRRDRVGEGDLDVDFLLRVYNRYEEWATTQSRVPILRIDTADVDYVNSPEDSAAIVRRVETMLTDALVLS